MSFTVPTDYASRPVAVIGAGTLGRRIALIFAAHGAQVTFYDLAEAQRHQRQVIAPQPQQLNAGDTGHQPPPQQNDQPSQPQAPQSQ